MDEIQMCKYISVTQLLTRLGFIDYSWVSPERREAAMRRGLMVAEATELLDKTGQRHWNPEMDGYLDAWELFKKEFNFRPILIEQELEDTDKKLNGRVDRHGVCYLGYGGSITVEIKTGKLADWFKYQTALYEYLINKRYHYGKLRTFESSPNRWAILLRPDGTYRPQRHTDPNDLRVIFKRWKEMSDELA